MKDFSVIHNMSVAATVKFKKKYIFERFNTYRRDGRIQVMIKLPFE